MPNNKNKTKVAQANSTQIESKKKKRGKITEKQTQELVTFFISIKYNVNRKRKKKKSHMIGIRIWQKRRKMLEERLNKYKTKTTQCWFGWCFCFYSERQIFFFILHRFFFSPSKIVSTSEHDHWQLLISQIEMILFIWSLAYVLLVLKWSIWIESISKLCQYIFYWKKTQRKIGWSLAFAHIRHVERRIQYFKEISFLIYACFYDIWKKKI